MSIFIIAYSRPGIAGWHNINYTEKRDEAESYVAECVERRKGSLESKEDVYVRRQGDISSVYSQRKTYMFLPSLQEIVSFRIEELAKDNGEEEFRCVETPDIDDLIKNSADFS